MDLDRQGEPEPRVAYLQSADALAGVHAIGLVLAAIHRRERTLTGGWIPATATSSF